MKQIIVTRGLPASGKSTWAMEALKASPETIIRVERDLLRDQLFGNRHYSKPVNWRMSDEEFKAYLDIRENTVTKVQTAMVSAALDAGKTVIISDTNLRAQHVRAWAKLAASKGAEFRQVIFDSSTLDELIMRDMNRDNYVGSDVIRMMWNKFTKNGNIEEVDVTKEINSSLTVEPYDNPTNLPSAIIVDIDGTLATMADRSPYEWHRVGEDKPVQAVIDAVNAAYQNGDEIIVMSGRDGSCMNITYDWLMLNLRKVSDFKLFMRAEGDNRKDDLVKYELFNNNIRGKYHVKYVLDDRDQVIRMWRALGLAAFQVNYGDF